MPYDLNDFMKAIKKAAVEAVNASKPTAIVFGKVISTSPLKINVDQKLTLTKAQLILTKNVTNHQVNVTVSWTTENAQSHTHGISGVKTMTIHNGLSTGDEVVMIQEPGGQRFIVIDKVG